MAAQNLPLFARVMKGFPNSLLLDIHVVYYFLTNRNNVVINIPTDKS